MSSGIAKMALLGQMQHLDVGVGGKCAQGDVWHVHIDPGAPGTEEVASWVRM